MKFTLEPIVTCKDIKNVDAALADINFNDIDAMQKKANELLALISNFKKFGMTESVVSLVRPSLESWNIKCDNITVCMESMWDKFQAGARDIWAKIVAAIRRFGEIVMNLFSKRDNLKKNAGKVDQLTFKELKALPNASTEAWEDNPAEYVGKKWGDVVSNKALLSDKEFIEIADISGKMTPIQKKLSKFLSDLANNVGAAASESIGAKYEDANAELTAVPNVEKFLSTGEFSDPANANKSFSELGHTFTKSIIHSDEILSMQKELQSTSKEMNAFLDKAAKQFAANKRTEERGKLKTSNAAELTEAENLFHKIFATLQRTLQADLRRGMEGLKTISVLDNAARKLLKSNDIQ